MSNEKKSQRLEKVLSYQEYKLKNQSTKIVEMQGSLHELNHFRNKVLSSRIWRTYRLMRHYKNKLHKFRIKKVPVYIKRRFLKKDGQYAPYTDVSLKKHFQKIVTSGNMEPQKYSGEQVLVDIIIPVYNAVDKLKKCVQSIYENTEVRYNLIIIDDCSPDPEVSKYLAELKAGDKPDNLLEFILASNETNLGFVGNVNRGFAISQNHPLILNSDTEVTEGWIAKMVYPMTQNRRIASVTPMSNKSTVFSFPDQMKNSELLYGLTPNEINGYFEKFGCNTGVEVYSGHGFCMLMNRKVLNKIGDFDEKTFRKGYGEETDWCMRAYEEGYVNLGLTNTFIFHNEGASFNPGSTISWKLRIEENMRRLGLKHPQYHALVNESFIPVDPFASIRNTIATKISIDLLKKPGILIINNDRLGGGSKLYLDTFISKQKNENRVYELIPEVEGFRIVDYNLDEKREVFVSYTNKDILKDVLDFLDISSIFINQLVGLDVYQMLELISGTELPYSFIIHDYFCVCPSFNLLKINGIYCEAETNLEVCQECLLNGLITRAFIPEKYKEGVEIAQWRKTFETFLMGASNVISPSKVTADIVKKYYPQLRIEIVPHSVSKKRVAYSYSPLAVENEILNFAVLGSISHPKGENIIEEVVKEIEKQDLSIKITVIGITSTIQIPYISPSGKFEVTGSYKADEIYKLLYLNEVAAVIIPSVWPETYSYTTTEALTAGYPVITYDLGAPGARVKELDAGWVIQEKSSKALLNTLIHLSQNRGELILKAEELRQKLKAKI